MYGCELDDPAAQNYGTLLKNKGLDISSLSSPGGGFQASGVNGTFYNMINNYNGNANFTDVYFLEGVNDSYTDLSKLQNEVINTINYAKEKFPKAKIHIGYISKLQREDMNENGVKITKNIYKECAKLTNIVYVKDSEDFLADRTDYIGPDGCHPTVLGQIKLADSLETYICNN